MAQFNMKSASVVLLALALVATTFKTGSAVSLGLVNTGVSKLSTEGRHVSVYLPGIFNFNLDTRGNHTGAKMDQSVLSGLVRVNLDRKRGADNKLHGPISVSVAGMTMYDNEEASPA